MSSSAPLLAAPTEATTATATFKVEGMACERCAARLSDGIKKVAGIVDAAADHAKKSVAVRYDPGRITPEQP